jgi:ParB family transcriptional regulator, chromosome partitioning protein
MSRRTGLGRGLAALIPPSAQDDEHAGHTDEETATRDADGAADPDSVATPTAGDATPQGPASEASSRETGRPLEASSGGEQAAPALGYLELDPEDITPNPRQPRDVFDPEELEGLATSLADIGMLQPLVVRQRSDGRYELIAGERRWRAAQVAGLRTVPALVRRTEDADLLKEALVENIHRVQLNPLEEAAAYQQLLQEFGVTQEELATRLGRSRPSISNAIRLLQLPAPVQRRVAAGVLSAGHAKVLLALPDPTEQARLAERIVAEGLSVRATEEHVRLRLTDEPTPRRSPSRRQPTAPGLLELQDDLSDALQARVRITMGARKGKLAVEFGSVDDLERIVAVIADGLAHSAERHDAPVVDDPAALTGSDAFSRWDDEAE